MKLYYLSIVSLVFFATVIPIVGADQGSGGISGGLSTQCGGRAWPPAGGCGTNTVVSNCLCVSNNCIPGGTYYCQDSNGHKIKKSGGKCVDGDCYVAENIIVQPLFSDPLQLSK